MWERLFADCITLHAEKYQELLQSIPSIESVGDSISDDEDEDIIFSGLHNSHQEVGEFNILTHLEQSPETSLQYYNSALLFNISGTTDSRGSAFFVMPNTSKAIVQLAT